jgi:hypothetical protein
MGKPAERITRRSTSDDVLEGVAMGNPNANTNPEVRNLEM